jgi:AraC family transcriptional regulator, positive regulator of tynA and feaB
MVVLLDTQSLVDQDPNEALQEAFSSTEAPQVVRFDSSPAIRHLMELSEFGPAAHVLRNTGTGVHIVRGPAQVRRDAPEQTAIGVQLRGHALLRTLGSESVTNAGHLHLVDVTSPYSYRQFGDSDHKVLLIDNKQLGLPVDVIRTALPKLQGSPIYDLVRAHIARLGDAPDLSAVTRELVGLASLQLIHALISSTTDGRQQREALNATLQLRIVMYLDANLQDHRLTPDSVASAHNISTRHLFAIWRRANHDLSLSQWIISRRLKRAEVQLSETNPVTPTIARIAHDCGFTDVSHFSRRFREAYGMSPREWRAHQAPHTAPQAEQ